MPLGKAVMGEVECGATVFLGAFVKLRKPCISFVMSVGRVGSFRMEQLGFHWMDFREI
jgi:hypothetical protein